MDVEGIKINRPEEIKPTLRKALTADKPYLIDVDINLHIPGYRAVWYRYPSNFQERGLEKPIF
jgi:acetolactate synthase-1/2/3 large subunit